MPRVAYVNKLDRMGADFWACVAQMKTKLFANPCVVTIPAGQDDQLEGIIDLIGMKLVTRTTRPTRRTASSSSTTSPKKYLAEGEEGFAAGRDARLSVGRVR